MLKKSLILFLIVLLVSCSDDDDGGSGKVVVPPQRVLSGESIGVSAIDSNIIIKNQVVSHDDGNIYYEYLTFNGSGGSYSIYKEDSLSKRLTKISNFPEIASGDSDSTSDANAAPSTFTYDSATLTVTVGDSKTYLFKNETENGTCYITAPVALTHNDSSAESENEITDADSEVDKNSKLFGTWITSNSDKIFIIKTTGYITIKSGGNSQTFLYGEDDNGCIKSLDERAAANVFFFAKVSDSENLYWRVKVGSIVNSEGRALISNGDAVNFNSDEFLFMRRGGCYE